MALPFFSYLVRNILRHKEVWCLSYQIGQYRFKGAGTCATQVPATKAYKTVGSNDVEEANGAFYDISVVPTTSLSRSADYYLYLKIPQDMNYNYTFNIKLVKQEEAGGSDVYQFLRQMTIPRGGSGENTYNVVLYETSTGAVSATIPDRYQAGVKNVKDMLYYDEDTEMYYLGNGNTTYTRTNNINDVSMTATWKTELSQNFAYLEFVFRPVEANFTQIVLEMVRTAEDYNIQRNGDNGVEYGRKINLADFDFELYRLTNLVSEINPDGALDRIGVWGHPGLIMAINGEEIKVGPSGLYELDVEGLPIETLGISARTWADQFTIDYQIEKE